MKQSFASIAPPEPYKIRVTASDRNGAEIDMEFQEASVPLAQSSMRFAVEQIKNYVPGELREQVKPGKDDKAPNPFPQGPQTGPIELDEAACFETANMFFQQVPAGAVPWTEFVYMRATAPNCYNGCRKTLWALSQGVDLEGNLLAAPGSDTSARQPENP